MGFDADSIGHDFYRLVIGNVRNIINELFYILQFEREFFQLFPLHCNLFCIFTESLILVQDCPKLLGNHGLLLFNDFALGSHPFLLFCKNKVLLLQIFPSPVLRFFLQVQAMLFRHFKEKHPAGGIKNHLPVVVSAGLFLRLRQFKSQRLQCLFLLLEKLPIFVLTIEYMTFMDVRCRFIQMERPVQRVDMGTEAPVQLCYKFCNYLQKHFRGNVFLHISNLVNCFFRAGLFVHPDFFNGAVTLGMPGLSIPGILPLHKWAVFLDIIKLLHFFKGSS